MIVAMATQAGRKSEDKEKFCKHCKKIVVTSLDCENCGICYHPSCRQQKKTQIVQIKLKVVKRVLDVGLGLNEI